MDATADVSSLGLQRYDGIISTEVVEHICLPRKYIRNCRLLLKPGGTLVLSTPYHGYIKNLLIALLNGSDQHWESLTDYGHVKFWSVDSIAALLHEAGFDKLEWQGAGRGPYLWKSMIIRAQVSDSLTIK
jgi:2-polyprenyl-6-hydroxyphenyl methylase/3-demethylubiquinone-9 3-methyltransferase